MAELAGPSSARAAQIQKQVLVLYSARRDAQIVTIGERELPRILEKGLGEVDYYSEYFDQARFPEQGYQEAFREFLRLKYKNVQFDVLIAVQTGALDLLAGARQDLFPGTPIVFFVASPVGRTIDNATGIVADLDLSGTLLLLTELQPRVRQVFVVTGAAPADQDYERLARDQLRRFESRFTITYLNGLPTRELESRLASLPADSAVYYLVANRDGEGNNVHPLEYLERLTAIANAPVYCWVDSAMDRGIIGGNLKDQTAQFAAVGRLALRVLSGEAAESIPVSSVNLNVNQVDWRQLRRWGISEARLPPGTLVKFREPSPWARYKPYILTAAAVLMAQTALIVALLVQGTRRRRAEEQMRASEAQLRTTYDRIRDLGSRLLNAQETERSRIARELHDDIGQQLAVLTIDLELLTQGAQERTKALADEALQRAHTIGTSVHDLSHRLHPAKLRLLGLVTALQALQRELSQSDISVTFTHDDIPPRLPPDLTLCLFRVVQEALGNAVKHGHANDISVHLARGAHGLTLTIIDDGVGFDVNAAWGKGLGLISMRERLDAIGGTLEIHSGRGVGTCLEISAPFSVAEGTEAAAV